MLNQTQIHTWWGQGGPALGLFAVSGGCSVRVVLWCFFSHYFYFLYLFYYFICFCMGFILGFFGRGGSGSDFGWFLEDWGIGC